MSSPPPSNTTHTLLTRQQPSTASTCPISKRRSIGPPPSSTSPDPLTLRGLTLHCILEGPISNSDVVATPSSPFNRLFSTLTSQPFHGFDEHGIKGTFFTYPSLSMREPGIYKLQFELSVPEEEGWADGDLAPVRALAESQAFRWAISLRGGWKRR